MGDTLDGADREARDGVDDLVGGPPVSGLRTRLRAALHPKMPLTGGDRGAALVEMIVYCAVLAIVLPLVGSVLVNALGTQRDVQAVTAAGTSVQTVTRSLELGVRNASAVSSVVYRPVAGGGFDEFVVARTQKAGVSPASWLCQAWFYDATKDVLYTRSAPAAGAAPVITMPASGGATSWTPLAEGVTPTDASSPVFFAWTGGLSVDLAASAGKRKPVVLSSAIARRTQWQTGSQPCF
jgi:hypothetical protein